MTSEHAKGEECGGTNRKSSNASHTRAIANEVGRPKSGSSVYWRHSVFDRPTIVRGRRFAGFSILGCDAIRPRSRLGVRKSGVGRSYNRARRDNPGE